MSASEALALPPSLTKPIVFQPKNLRAHLHKANVSITVDRDLPPYTPVLIELAPPEAFELTVDAQSREVFLGSTHDYSGGSVQIWVAPERPASPEELFCLDHDPDAMARWDIRTTHGDIRIMGYPDMALILGDLAVKTSNEGGITVDHAGFPKLILTQPDNPGHITIGDDVSAMFIFPTYA